MLKSEVAGLTPASGVSERHSAAAVATTLDG